MLEEEFKLKEEAVRRSNETLALGQGALVSAARGIWWDCLGSKPVPLDVEHVEGSHINFKALLEEGELWGVYHELTDMFRFGFSYKADRELQVVGCPALGVAERKLRTIGGGYKEDDTGRGDEQVLRDRRRSAVRTVQVRVEGLSKERWILHGRHAEEEADQ